MIALAVTDAPTDAEREAVRTGLRAHNDAAIGPGAFVSTPLTVVARNADGAVVGGLIALTVLRCLFVDLLHVDAALRGTGLGTQLLDAAEAEARARGCVGVRLDTFSFQAPGFYAKRGYTVLGTLDDAPPGHARHFLFKRLPTEANGGPLCST